MAAFFFGYCLSATLWCAAEWERTRSKFDAVFFRINLIAAISNALFWWAS